MDFDYIAPIRSCGKKCRTILDSVLTIFDDPDTAQAVRAVDSYPVIGYSGIRNVIADILLEEVVRFKNKDFEVEKEWRIVVRQREMLKQGIDDGGKTPTPVYFRSSNGMLAPYVKLIPIEPSEKLPVACVRSGPTLDKTTARMAVQMILDKNGFYLPSHYPDESHVRRTHMRILIGAALTAVACLPAATQEQEGQKTVAEFARAWEQRNATAMAGLYTEDADVRGGSGGAVRGQEKLVKALAR
jgi:hypothetical protein